MTIREIKKIRNQLPDNWKWQKCYEKAYRSSRTGYQITKTHWALCSPDNPGIVCSLGLISHDYFSSRSEFMEDAPVQFVEKSLLIIDTLLAEIDKLQQHK